jgi:hypothetical protein
VPPASVTVLSGLAGDHGRVKMPRPVLLSAADAATYGGVRPATLRVWRHWYRLTRRGTAERDLYDLDELAAILAPRAGD